MKKIVVLGVVCILSMLVVGCTNEQKNTVKDKYFDMLVGTEWIHYNAVGEDMNLSFSEEGDFACYSAAGEPIGNSDLYDKFVLGD